MTTQAICLPRSATTSRRASAYPRQSGRGVAPRAYDRAIEARQPLSLPLPATGVQTKSILLVDDIGTTGPLVYLLHTLGCRAIRSASSGATALSLAQVFLPSIVLISLQLPDMDAYRVAEQLRNQAGRRPTRIIALTTESLHCARDLARQAGFERYLAKPVGAVALLQLLRPQLP